MRGEPEAGQTWTRHRSTSKVMRAVVVVERVTVQAVLVRDRDRARKWWEPISSFGMKYVKLYEAPESPSAE